MYCISRKLKKEAVSEMTKIDESKIVIWFDSGEFSDVE